MTTGLTHIDDDGIPKGTSMREMEKPTEPGLTANYTISLVSVLRRPVTLCEKTRVISVYVFTSTSAPKDLPINPNTLPTWVPRSLRECPDPYAGAQVPTRVFRSLRGCPGPYAGATSVRRCADLYAGAQVPMQVPRCLRGCPDANSSSETGLLLSMP